jgi:hypothetical protein
MPGGVRQCQKKQDGNPEFFSTCAHHASTGTFALKPNDAATFKAMCRRLPNLARRFFLGCEVPSASRILTGRRSKPPLINLLIYQTFFPFNYLMIWSGHGWHQGAGA